MDFSSLPPVILASTSPARKKLLEQLRIPFEVVPANINEKPLSNETPEALVRRLAETKARTIAQNRDDVLIIGADQVIVLDNIIQGKSLTHENAVQQLLAVSGKKVRSLTGLCVLNTKTQQMQIDIATYDVTYRDLTLDIIQWYLEHDKPYECAGSLRAEGLGIVLIKEMSGRDPNALVGLPIMMLVDMLINLS